MTMIKYLSFVGYVSVMCSLASSRTATAEGGLIPDRDAVANTVYANASALGTAIPKGVAERGSGKTGRKAGPQYNSLANFAQYLCDDGELDEAKNLVFDLDQGNRSETVPNLYTIRRAKFFSEGNINLVVPAASCANPNAANIVSTLIRPPTKEWQAATCLLTADGQMIQAKALYKSGNSLDIYEPESTEVCSSQVEYWKRYVTKLAQRDAPKSQYARQDYKAEP